MDFMHFRRYDSQGRPENKGGATFAYEQVGDKFRYSFAFCNPKDNFSRKIGRAISSGRLDSGRFLEVPTADADHNSLREFFYDRHNAILEHVIGNGD